MNIYLNRLDHLRFFAAFVVIAHHFRGNVGTIQITNDITLKNLILVILDFGSVGVSFFLVLSGFLFMRQAILQPEKVRFGNFILRRIVRIFPLLIFVFLMIIAASRATSTPMDVFRLLTLQLNTGQSFTGWGHDYLPVGPIWTIAVEFQFYLLFPVLYLTYVRYSTQPIKALILLILTINLFKVFFIQIHPDMYWNLYHTLFGRLDQFLVGMIAGILYVQKNKFIQLHGKISLITYVLLLLAFVWYSYGLGHYVFGKSLNFVIEAFLFSGIILSYLSKSLIINNYVSNMFSYLGNRSYSMYLLHLLIGGIVINKLNLNHNTLLEYLPNLVILVILVILVSDLTYRTIEKPFMDTFNNIRS